MFRVRILYKSEAKVLLHFMTFFFGLVVVFYCWLCLCVVGLALFLCNVFITLRSCFYSSCIAFIFLTMLLLFSHYSNSSCYLHIVSFLFSCCFTLLLFLPHSSSVVTLILFTLLLWFFSCYCVILFHVVASLFLCYCFYFIVLLLPLLFLCSYLLVFII